MVGRVADEVVLSAEERVFLEAQVRRHKAVRSLSDRCRMILLCAGGLQSKEVGAQLGVHEHTVGKWRRRFVKDRRPWPSHYTVSSRRLHIPSGTRRPIGRLRRNPPSGEQHITGDGQLVRQRADAITGVMQHRILEIDMLAVDPQRGPDIGKVHALDPPFPTDSGRCPRPEGQRDARPPKHQQSNS